MNLVQLADKAHFAKAFDSSRQIPDSDFQLLIRFLHSIPQSVNAQSTHHFIAATPATRARIAAALGGGAEFNGPKVRDASHVIVFATRETLTDAYLDEIHAKEIADGKFPDAARAEQWKRTVRSWIDHHRYEVKDLHHWCEKQAYLAVGMMLMAAEELGINAIPMEGFDAATLDAGLGLRAQGLTATLVLALGYRGKGDYNVNTPKSRLPMERNFTFL